MKWAVRTHYVTDDYKKHTRMSKWYDNPDDAWNDKDSWELKHEEIIESRSSLVHKG